MTCVANPPPLDHADHRSAALFVRFFEFDLWLQVAFVALALLVIVLAGLILVNLVAYTVALIIPGKQEPVTRRMGFAEIGLGLTFAAIGMAMATLPDWLPRVTGTSAQGWPARASHLSLPILAASLYALSEGLGAALLARRRVGVVMLIWAMVAGVVWLVSGFF
jgi:hypothetical protein